MFKNLYKIGLPWLLFLLITGLPIFSVYAQLVRETDPDCIPAFTARSELLIPFIDEYYPSYGADVSPDGKLLAVVAVNRVILFDTNTFKSVQQVRLDSESWTSSRAASWSPDNTSLAVYIGPEDGILILNTTNAEIEHLLPTNDYYTMIAYTLSWSPDGSKLAVLGDLPWRVWDVESEQILYEVVPEKNTVNRWVLDPLLYGEQYMAAWSLDGSQLAVPERGNDVALLDTTTWSQVTTLPVNFDRVVSLEWSNTGQLFITGAPWDLDVWDPASEERIAQVRLPTSVVVKLSLEETLLAVAGRNNISILDPETLEIITTITSETIWGSIINLHWLDDERVIVYGEYSLVEVWNIKTGDMEHTWHINCIAQE